jgi:hypothetical protein
MKGVVCGPPPTAGNLACPTQAVDAKDSHLHELRHQLEASHKSSEGAALEHDAQLSKLISSLQQMKDACTVQVRGRSSHCVPWGHNGMQAASGACGKVCVCGGGGGAGFCYV